MEQFQLAHLMPCFHRRDPNRVANMPTKDESLASKIAATETHLRCKLQNSERRPEAISDCSGQMGGTPNTNQLTQPECRIEPSGNLV
jgi:hypothetical protein